MSCSLVRVDFHGDTLECVERDGKVWVSIKRVCEVIGIDHSRQIRKLRDDECCTVDEMSTVGQDGKIREMSMLELKFLAGWLFTISPGKVKQELRDKLILYKNECYEYLDQRFRNRPQAEMAVPVQALASLTARLDQQAATLNDLLTRMAGTMVAMLERFSDNSNRSNVTPVVGYVTIEQRLHNLRWFDATKKDKARIRRMANDRLLTQYGEYPSYALDRCVYFNHQIRVLDECIEAVRRQAERERGSEQGVEPGLFDEVK
jgi:hypothetical protein